MTWLNDAPRPDVDWYVTFGQQYPREQHPTWDGADHDGWVRISAATYEEAIDVTHDRFGVYWSNIYGADVWAEGHARFYPKGELAHFTGED